MISKISTFWFSLVMGCMLLPLCRADADDIDVIRKRVIAELMKTTVDDHRVQVILDNMNPDGSFKGIDYNDLSRTAGFPHRRHTADLLYLAQSFEQKTSRFFRSKRVKERIITSLQYWVDHDFFGDNWHDNQISTPTNLVNLMLVIGDELPADLVKRAQPIIGRANMSASGARPSGDRIVIAGILAKNLLFIGDRDGFDKIITLIEGEVKFNTGGRGMQHDYSFHHRTDRVNNTTSYGYGKYANAFGEWSYYVAGTRYAFSAERIEQLIDYYLDGIYKQMVYGVYADVSVKNRSISQQTTFAPHDVVEIERVLASSSYRGDELREIIRLRKGETKPSQSFAKFFWQTEHFVFQRPHFYTTVRMFSTRNRNMELPYNGPGITTHHRADGTNYLMLKGDEYHNIWPVYNWQKISGTTVLQKPALHGPENIQVEGLTDFVGAVTDGLYGAVAFDFVSPHDHVKARKSWFFFDEEYVCLGAGIRSSQPLPVATTVNQVLLRGDVTVLQDGKEAKLPPGDHTLQQVKWVHQDQVGYLFPEPVAIRLSNQEEQGRWSDITLQKNISTELVKRDVFTLWFDHGKNPDSAAYAYIVVPGVREEQLRTTATGNRGIDILSNTVDVQAVGNRALGIYQFAFYRAGVVRIPGGVVVGIEGPGMAIVKMRGDRPAELVVSDPSRKLSRIIVSLSGNHQAVGDDVIAVHDPEKDRTLMIIPLPAGVYAGKSMVVTLR